MGRLFWVAIGALVAAALLLIANHSSGSVFGLGNEDFGSLAYIGVLATVMATGILASRRFGEAMRTMAAWLMIILAFMTAYEYRYELQDIANRVSAGAVPASPLSAGDNDGRNTVTLRKRPDGHFEARISIDGRPVDTLVDTGATTSVLTLADAERVGIAVDDLRFSIPVSTANGVARAARVVAGEVSIGGIVRKNLPILVAESGLLSQSLLGMNFIGSLTGFDLRGDRLILRD